MDVGRGLAGRVGCRTEGGERTGKVGGGGVETCGDEKIHGVELVLHYEPLPEYFLVEKGGGEGVDTVGKPADVNVLFLAF